MPTVAPCRALSIIEALKLAGLVFDTDVKTKPALFFIQVSKCCTCLFFHGMNSVRKMLSIEK
ncbi:hypothetical protein HMPREF9554_00467 [Treponema phagedenis F0421]|nr:hypothetical protein HMPREF9554_00467 [Treponema phagedenis F0421]